MCVSGWGGGCPHKGLLLCVAKNLAHLTTHCVYCTFQSPWPIAGTSGIFYKFRKQLWYTEPKDFLKTFLEIPSSPLPAHSTTYYRKTGRLPWSSAAGFLRLQAHTGGAFIKSSIHAFLNFLLAQTKAKINSLLQEIFMEYTTNQIGMWVLIERRITRLQI